MLRSREQNDYERATRDRSDRDRDRELGRAAIDGTQRRDARTARDLGRLATREVERDERSPERER